MAHLNPRAPDKEELLKFCKWCDTQVPTPPPSMSLFSDPTVANPDLGHLLWSTTICILSLFTTGHACFRRLDDQISTNLVQIEHVSETPNKTFKNPKTGKSHGFSTCLEIGENLGQILNKSRPNENIGAIFIC